MMPQRTFCSPSDELGAKLTSRVRWLTSTTMASEYSKQSFCLAHRSRMMKVTSLRHQIKVIQFELRNLPTDCEEARRMELEILDLREMIRELM